MPPAQIPAVLLAIALWVAPCLAAAASAAGAVRLAARAAAAGGGFRPGAAQRGRDEDWRNSFTATVARARALLEAGYARAPALVIALGAFVVLPAVALVSLLVQSVSTAQSTKRGDPRRPAAGQTPAAAEIARRHGHPAVVAARPG